MSDSPTDDLRGIRDRPQEPDIPDPFLTTLLGSDVDTLRTVAEFAEELADWRVQKRAYERARAEQLSKRHAADLRESGVSADPADYADVPTDQARIAVVEQDGADYYCWEWQTEATQGDAETAADSTTERDLICPVSDIHETESERATPDEIGEILIF